MRGSGRGRVWLFLLAGALCAPDCILNPQPDMPADRASGTGGTTMGMGTGGSSQNGNGGAVFIPDASTEAGPQGTGGSGTSTDAGTDGSDHPPDAGGDASDAGADAGPEGGIDADTDSGASDAGPG